MPLSVRSWSKQVPHRQASSERKAWGPCLATRGTCRAVRRRRHSPLAAAWRPSENARSFSCPSPTWQVLFANPAMSSQGTEAEALAAGSPFHALSPFWKMMLLSDGSVTRHLELLTGCPVEVVCTSDRAVRCINANGMPANGANERSKQRTAGGGRCAAPAIPAAPDAVGRYMKDTSQPIWTNLSKGRTELYRDIRRVYLGECADLEEAFQQTGAFWGRDYVFWHNGVPLTAIHEVFSPALSVYLDVGQSRRQGQQASAC